MYTICNGQVKLSNKQYTSIKNDFSLTLDNNTDFVLCSDDPLISYDRFTFTFLKGIQKITPQSTIDVIGVVFEVGEVSTLNLRDGSTRDKCVITLGDESRVSIGVTLWGDLCEAHAYD